MGSEWPMTQRWANHAAGGREDSPVGLVAVTVGVTGSLVIKSQALVTATSQPSA